MTSTMGEETYPSDQPATYRHLLSLQTLGPSNPLRVIAHCDVDAAYAQFEAKRLNLDRSVPIAVQQWSALIAVNYAAREYGITRHENVFEAKKKCPDLVCVHVATLKDGDDEPGYHEKPNMNTDKVSLEPYRRESQKIIRLFNREAPTGEVEKASIDEAFLDLTVPIRAVLLKKYSFLNTVPPESPLGLDTPLPPAPILRWNDKPWGIVPVKADQDVTNAEPDLNTEAEGSWADVALWEGGEMLDRMRETIELELGYTTSAGVAHNKVLAKLCSAFKKPRAQTILRTSAVSQFLRPFKFQKIRNLGGKLGEVIAETYGAVSVEDLLKVDLVDMKKTLGEDSGWIYNILRGVDPSEVKAKSLPKSMMASKNMRPCLTNMEEGSSWLRVLSVELIGRLKEARELAGLDGGEGAGGVWPRTLVFSWREAGSASKSKQVPFPYHNPLSASGPILSLSVKLLSEILASNANLTSGQKQIRINNLALGFTQLERLETGQRGIQGFFAMPASETKSRIGEKRRLSSEDCESRSKRPESGWFQRAPLGHKAHLGATSTTSASVSTARGPEQFIKPPPSRTTSDEVKRPGPSVLKTHSFSDSNHYSASSSSSSSSSYSFPSLPRPSPKQTLASALDSGPSSSGFPSFWVCPECTKRIPLAQETMIDFDPEDEAKENERIRSEHVDWHVAVKLQAEFGGGLPSERDLAVGEKKSNSQKEGTGFGQIKSKEKSRILTTTSDPNVSKRKSGGISKPNRKGSGDNDRSSAGPESKSQGGLGSWLIRK